MASLELRKITKRFKDVVALSQIDLLVENGEFCVLLGPSGCGKSTLLQIVAGLVPQDEGSVLLDGEPVDHLSPRHRDVAMVFQNYALYPHMTVEQNLAFGLRMRGETKEFIKMRVLETARLLGIEGLLNRKPKELSGGQRQRVAMGRALVRKPKIFLLDEPLSNLDAQLRVSVRMELKRLHRQLGSTILYVTHDQAEAMSLGDKVVVMREGRIHQVGTPENIYEHPADTFVARFFGTPEMNLFKGRLVEVGGKQIFRSKDFSIDLETTPSKARSGSVEIGIRAEDIAIANDFESPLKGEVEMISNLGSERYAHVRIGSSTVTLRCSKKESLKPGEIVYLVMDHSRLHIFYEGKRHEEVKKGANERKN